MRSHRTRRTLTTVAVVSLLLALLALFNPMSSFRPTSVCHRNRPALRHLPRRPPRVAERGPPQARPSPPCRATPPTRRLPSSRFRRRPRPRPRQPRRRVPRRLHLPPPLRPRRPSQPPPRPHPRRRPRRQLPRCPSRAIFPSACWPPARFRCWPPAGALAAAAANPVDLRTKPSKRAGHLARPLSVPGRIRRLPLS